MLSRTRIVLMTLLLASTFKWSVETQKKWCKSGAVTICGGVNISRPFRIQHRGGGENCRYDRSWKVVECHNNSAFLPTAQGKFLIRDITYHFAGVDQLTGTIRLSDVALEADNCSLPRQALILPESNDDGDFQLQMNSRYLSSNMYLLNCSMKLNSSANFIDAVRSDCPSTSFFYFADQISQRGYFDGLCFIEAIVPIGISNILGLSTAELYQILSYGLDVEWWSYKYYHPSDYPNPFFVYDEPPPAHQSVFVRFSEWLVDTLKSLPKFIHDCLLGPFLARYSLGMLGLFALIIYKFKSKYLSVDNTIEEFLGKQDNLMSIRYSYSQIKKITECFKEELGRGGFGTVFKGKLQNGRLVAVKLLRENPHSNGQDFINEVGSIGSIHHVNVMRLIGFCVEGCKQALIYDFMPNGSLDKVIFSREKSLSLSWQKIFEIALGVARGIEYLHRGCDIQILHFDIKPHNILLDENFKPKVSDFGLAKLSSVDDTSITMSAARGTRGYIAPELLYRSIGGISYKADIYSFGMLLLEMAGRRRNLNTLVERSSQIYFPSWIYRRFENYEDYDDIGGVGDATEEEKMMIRKMALVGFWCTQTKPGDRPSMTKVLEMLEGGIELPLAPKPFAVSLHILAEEKTDVSKEEESPSTSSIQIECC